MKPHWSGVIAVTTILICCSSLVCQAKPIPVSSLRWAENLLARASNPINNQWTITTFELSDAEEAFQQILYKYGRSSRAYNGLARCRMNRSHYTQAITAYRKSLELSPDKNMIYAELQTALLTQQVAKLAVPDLPNGHMLVSINRYPLPNQPNMWVVLSARVVLPKKDEWGGWTEPSYMDTCISVFMQDGSHLKKLCDFQKIGYQEDYIDVHLLLHDMNHDGTKEIIVHLIASGGDHTPSYMNVFIWKNQQLHKVFGGFSDNPYLIKDINHDGRYEIIDDHMIGDYMCVADMPHWANIYAYKNGTFQLANGDYPSEFTTIQEYMKELLREFPRDTDLLEYLGTTYEIQKYPSLAIRSYRKAMQVYRHELNAERDPAGRARIQADINTIHQRIRRLKAQ